MPENSRLPLVFKRRKSIMQFRMQNRSKVLHNRVVIDCERFTRVVRLFSYIGIHGKLRSIKVHSVKRFLPLLITHSNRRKAFVAKKYLFALN